MNMLIDDEEVPRVAMQVTQNVLVVSVQVELYAKSLQALREDILDNIRRTGVRQALIDLSSVEVMDTYAYGSICDTANMAKVMGTDAVLTGIGPGVASALVELNVDVHRADTALNLESGFELLKSRDDGDSAEADAQDDDTDGIEPIAGDPDADSPDAEGDTILQRARSDEDNTALERPSMP
jgi:anti-anti-sigma factor